MFMKIVLLEPLGVKQAILAEFADRLTQLGHDFTAYANRPADEEELKQRMEGADAVMIANMPLRAPALGNADTLKYVNVAFTGVDHLDVDFCREHGISVSNASGYSDIAVAELAFSMMLSLVRNVKECDSAVRAGGTKDGLIGTELYGKTLGVVGTGKIGSAVIRIAQAFGCNVIAYNRSIKPELEAAGVRFVSLEELMEQCDIVTVHVPQNASTNKLISKELIAKMKPNAIFINTARGPIVDNAALAEALRDGKIAGAGIDVFEMEPPVPSDHPLLDAPHTLLTPHVAFATTEALERRARIVFENTYAWLNGEILNKIC